MFSPAAFAEKTQKKEEVRLKRNSYILRKTDYFLANIISTS